MGSVQLRDRCAAVFPKESLWRLKRVSWEDHSLVLWTRDLLRASPADRSSLPLSFRSPLVLFSLSVLSLASTSNEIPRRHDNHQSDIMTSGSLSLCVLSSRPGRLPVSLFSFLLLDFAFALFVPLSISNKHLRPIGPRSETTYLLLSRAEPQQDRRRSVG